MAKVEKIKPADKLMCNTLDIKDLNSAKKLAAFWIIRKGCKDKSEQIEFATEMSVVCNKDNREYLKKRKPRVGCWYMFKAYEHFAKGVWEIDD